jgi:hypothetical protein
MRSLKPIVISAIVCFCAFVAVIHSSCSKSACKGVTCINGGSCSGGSCRCSKAGIGGDNCELIYRQTYSNTYTGIAQYTTTVLDTNNTNHADTANTLTFTSPNDTADYEHMQIKWHSSNGDVTMDVELANNSTSGSTFKVTQFTASGISYTGSGTVSTSMASLTLTETQTGATTYIVSMNNFTKQ